MLQVGLTGGIASGKSLVARFLRDLGGHVVDADRIVHGLLECDQPTWQDICEHFGEAILLPDKCIDRRKLGDIVFNNEQERMWLNSLLHPRVFAAFQSIVRSMLNRPGDTVIILDAALLIETGYHKNMDKVIVVYAEPHQQLERLIARDCMTEEQARARIAAQMPLREKRSYADYVIDNTGTREYTEEQVRKLYPRLERESRENV
ncbi:MAG TPA: dephospho-CoA kinase [Nitrospirota bacterium]|nr:dephospho-CoA kinase [Nitrospirota bacterium]